MTRSAVRFAWVLNLDAELELARPGYVPRVKLTEQLAQHGARSRELLGPHDVLVDGSAHVGAGAIGRAWCPTPMAVAALRAAGVAPEPHPTRDVLRRVNHRRFAFELGDGLDHQAYLERRADVEAVLSRAERPWLLKRPLSFAGRGQMRVYGPVSDKQWSWVDASLRSDGLILEPFVELLSEFSLHGFVWPDGRAELGRICVQLVSVRGVFSGVKLATSGDLDATESRALFAEGERVATALGAAQYFGPFGIDAYRYRDGERVRFCALGEINARYTMGFGTGFPRHPSEIHLGSPPSGVVTPPPPLGKF